ncbi:hypothetical protein, partial [Yoonia sp.]|uniref:hypothetical protein n=1 Tax=Yoonia sp. TaxID=2212373 RepID=UPI0025D262D1
MDILNIIFAALSIGLGCFGWLAPRYTMATIDLVAGASTMGPSEIRASAGALFVGMGVGALLIGTPAAFAMLGFCWSGAAAYSGVIRPVIPKVSGHPFRFYPATDSGA